MKKKKSHVILCSKLPCNHLGEKEKALKFQICSQERWVKNGRGEQKAPIYPSPVGHVFSVFLPPAHRLAGKAQLRWFALPRWARYWECRGLGKSSLPLPERHVPPAVNQLMKLSSFLRGIMDWEGEAKDVSKAVNNLLLLSNACSRELDQSECESLRKKMWVKCKSVTVEADLCECLESQRKRKALCSSFGLFLWQFSFQ